MAAKKNPSRRPVDPAPKKKSTADIDNMTSIRAGMKQAAAYKKNWLDRKDANGNSYFGATTEQVLPKGPQGQTPAQRVPPDYKPKWIPGPWNPDSPYNPKNTPKVPAPSRTPNSPSKPKTPDAPSTTTTTQPRGMAQSGKIVSSEPMAKKKKKK